MTRTSIAPLACLSLIVATARGGEDDPVAARVTGARAAYDRGLEAFQRDVLAAIQVEEGQALRAGDDARADQIARDRGAFEADFRDLPGSISRDRIAPSLRRLAAASADLDKAYNRAIASYTKAKRAQDAREARVALQKFRAESRPRAQPQAPARRGRRARPDVDVAPPTESAMPAVPLIGPLRGATSWDFIRTNDTGVALDGSFKIVNGKIYYLDSPSQVGVADQDAQGRLLLRFWNHRKLVGDADLGNDGPGVWSGPLVMPDGLEWVLQITKR